jgi:hypothetical protein
MAPGTKPRTREKESEPTEDGMLITAIVRDVTERKAVLARERQARREAEESFALLGTILAAVPLGIAYVGSDSATSTSTAPLPR